MAIRTHPEYIALLRKAIAGGYHPTEKEMEILAEFPTAKNPNESKQPNKPK